jgi:hypothetical protein
MHSSRLLFRTQAAEQLRLLTHALDTHAHADRSLRVRCHLRLAEWLSKLNEMEDESADGHKVLERADSSHSFIARADSLSNVSSVPVSSVYY